MLRSVTPLGTPCYSSQLLECTVYILGDVLSDLVHVAVLGQGEFVHLLQQAVLLCGALQLPSSLDKSENLSLWKKMPTP